MQFNLQCIKTPWLPLCNALVLTTVYPQQTLQRVYGLFIACLIVGWFESACVHACSVLAGGVRTDTGVKKWQLGKVEGNLVLFCIQSCM